MKNAIISAVLVCYAVSAHAQWVKTNSPKAGGINCFANAGTAIFAGTDSAGTIFSADNGSTWTLAASGLASKNIRSLASSGQNTFAGTPANGVFLSTDNGANWAAVSNGLTNSSVNALITTGKNIFAGTNAGVFVSDNNGTDWAEANNGLPKIAVSTLAVSGNKLFAGTYGGGVYLTTDNGSTWAAVNTGLSSDSINALAISGADIYAATNSSGVFISGDNGSHWAAVNTGLTNMHVWALAISGKNVFAGTGGGGKGNGTGGGTGGGKGKGGVFSSADNGNTWVAVNTGLPKTDVRSLFISGNWLIAGTSDANVWKRPLSDLTSGIHNLSAGKTVFTLYPNPAASQINITWYTNEKQDIVISNISGETVYSSYWLPFQNQKTIDISSLPKGVYYIRIGAGTRGIIKN